MPNEDLDGHPPYLKGFFVLLPDALPIPDGSTVTFYTDEPEPLLESVAMAPMETLPPVSDKFSGRNFVSIRFLQMRDPIRTAMEADNEILMHAVHRICKGAEGDRKFSSSYDSDKDDRLRTVVEMVTFVAKSEDLIATAHKPDPLTRCLTKLFEYHRSYRLLAKLVCEELTYKRLFPIVLMTHKPAASTEPPVPDGLIMLDMRPNRFGIPSAAIGDINFADVTYTYLRLSAGDPAVAHGERIADARFAYYELGKNAEAVVHLATACEIIFDGLLGMILWEARTAETDAAGIFSRDIVPRIKNEYECRLGGNWSLSAGPVGGWYESVAGLRNRVVHAGYRPSDKETNVCFDAVDDLSEYILDRLYDKAHKYPCTAWDFLGEPGFAARGGVTRRAREWLERQTETTVDRISSYAAWRTKVDQVVQRRRKAT
ncbi:hypothetical protein ACWFPY_05760 [Nocardia fluminea]